MYIHNLNPVLVDLGIIQIRWYSLAYIFGILIGYYFAKHLTKNSRLKNIITDNLLENYLIYLIVGIILGGRLGYVIFYNASYFIQNPIEIFFIWQGGMSFHGGILGVFLSTFYFCKKQRIHFLNLLDLIVVVAPIGIFLGRIANFINAELVGKVTGSNYGVIFPSVDKFPRHPSQLYEALLEGMILFLILQLMLWKKRSLIRGELSCYFIILYSIFRMICEVFREPDEQIGYVIFSLSLGTILSFIFFAGALLILKKIHEPTFKVNY